MSALPHHPESTTLEVSSDTPQPTAARAWSATGHGRVRRLLRQLPTWPPAGTSRDGDSRNRGASSAASASAAGAKRAVLAPLVRDSLDLLLGAVDARPLGERLSEQDAASALALVEAGEAVTAWVESVQVDATERLHAALREDLLVEAELADASSSVREREEAGVRDTTCAEIESATGRGQAAVRGQVNFALASHDRTGRARELMRQGRCSRYRARIVLEETRDLSPDVVDEISDQVLGCRPDGTPWSHRQFRARLASRVRARTDAARKRVDALARRDAGAQLRDDGTGEVWITGKGDRVVAAMDRVDALARRFRTAGDCRTLAQLRSDVALDLLLYGWVHPTNPAASTGQPPRAATGSSAPADHSPAAGSPAAGGSAGSSPTAGGSAGSPTAVGSAAGSAFYRRPTTSGPAGGPEGTVPTDPMSGYRALGAPPVAHVELVVPLTTLLGLDDGVGQLAGRGPVPAAQAREIALRLGSTWARIVTDPITGRCLERSTSTYRFDTDMARQIRARDGTCRGPGCTIPASRCDLDHEQEWRVDESGHPVGGVTSESNGYAKHRRHHNLKTRGHWRSEPGPDGSLIWSTATGRRYVTWPMDYHEETQTTPPVHSAPVDQGGTAPTDQISTADDLADPPF